MLEHGHFKPNLEAFNCVTAINDLTVSLKPQFDHKNNTFTVQYAQNFPDLIYSDKNRLLQVLLNLLTNANKFTENGDLTLNCEFGMDRI